MLKLKKAQHSILNFLGSASLCPVAVPEKQDFSPFTTVDFLSVKYYITLPMFFQVYFFIFINFLNICMIERLEMVRDYTAFLPSPLTLLEFYATIAL